MELEENRDKAMKDVEYQQMLTKRTFDKKTRSRDFMVGGLMMKWDILRIRLGHHTKFENMWMGSFIIMECKEHNSFQMATTEGEVLPISVNEIHLKPCFEVWKGSSLYIF